MVKMCEYPIHRIVSTDSCFTRFCPWKPPWKCSFSLVQGHARCTNIWGAYFFLHGCLVNRDVKDSLGDWRHLRFCLLVCNLYQWMFCQSKVHGFCHWSFRSCSPFRGRRPSHVRGVTSGRYSHASAATQRALTNLGFEIPTSTRIHRAEQLIR